MIWPVRGPWRNYGRCDQCGAEAGKPCLNLQSLCGRMRYREPIDQPHRGRNRTSA